MAEQENIQDLESELEVIMSLNLEQDQKEILSYIHTNFANYIIRGGDPFKISREELERKRETLRQGVKEGSWYAKHLERVVFPLYENPQHRQQIIELYQNEVLPNLEK